MLYGLSILICRGMALMVALYLVSSFWMFASLVASPNLSAEDKIAYAAVPFSYFVLIAVFWFGAPWLGKKMVRDIPESDLQKPSPVKFEELAMLGSALAGLLILVESIGSLIRGLPEIMQLFDSSKQVNWGIALQGLLMFLLGSFLLFRPSDLGKMLTWLRRKT